MNWEEYENSDWYREAHPERFEKPTRAQQVENLMRDYLSDIDEFRKQISDEETFEHNGEVYECSSHELVEGVVMNVAYVCAPTWNGRVRGVLACGSYEECRLKKYEYDLAHLNSEWEWACVEKITYTNDDELDDILIGYRECEYEDYAYDSDEY